MNVGCSKLCVWPVTLNPCYGLVSCWFIYLQQVPQDFILFLSSTAPWAVSFKFIICHCSI
jgi:hypothetical protein